jgi:hypothetical protein
MRVDCAQKGIANPRFKASGLQIRWNGHTNELGQRTGGITLGIGVTVAYDAVPPIIPIKVNGNVNYGATTIGDVRGIVPTLRESFKLR